MMTKKKPDRFTRLVLAEMKKNDTPGNHCIWLNGPDVVELLRKEQRKVLKIVKSHYFPTAEPGSVNYGYNQAVDFILDALKKRAI